MAITLQPTKVSASLTAIVDSSVSAVKAVRSQEQARKEAEFQRAIANGMLYEEQVKFREQQLKDEQSSSFRDEDYVGRIEKSITDTKRLARFNKYRTKYAEALGELSSGKINEESYLQTLESALVGIDDPELRLEIQGDITAAQEKVKSYRDTILTNHVKKAKYDGTSSALSSAISEVSSARMLASISGNDDEVSAYDETLSALNSQLSTTRIQDSITNFQVTSATRGTNPVEKLNYINSEIAKADGNVAIKIGDRTYTSAQQFWSLERDSYLSGSSQIFGNFFTELDSDTKNKIAVDSAKFGYPTQTILDETLQTFEDLRTKPEIAPFVNRLDITQAGILATAVDKLAKTINDVGTNNLTFKEADAQLQNIAARYGIDVTSYRLQLDEQLRNLARGGVIDEAEAVELAPDVTAILPKVDTPEKPGTPATPATPATPGVVPSVGGSRVVRAGDTLSGIAKEAGVPLNTLLELNPELKANPNLIKPGQQVKLPDAQTPAPVTPTATPTESTSAATPTTPSQPATPAPTSGVTSTPVTQTPPAVQTPAATPPTPASNYKGSSIVDYLKSVGQDSSAGARAKLAMEKGIVKTEQEYLDAAKVGANAQFNERLLKSLRQ